MVEFEAEKRGKAPQLLPLLPALLNTKREMWYSIESFLSAWARTSLIFFPDQRGDQARGQYLRKVFQMDEDHIIGNRKLRNDWMHFDERLDKALKTACDITPYDFVKRVGESKRLVLCEIATESFKITFLGKESHDLDPVTKVAEPLRKQMLERVSNLF